jgi:hypothetical protein
MMRHSIHSLLFIERPWNLGVADRIWKYFKENEVPESVSQTIGQALVDSDLGEYEGYDYDGPTEGPEGEPLSFLEIVTHQPELLRRRRVANRFAIAIADECKATIPGITNNTGANRLVAHRFIRDAMVRHGVRPTHIIKYLPISLEYVFIPNEAQIDANKMRHARITTQRQWEESRLMYSRDRPWLFNWIGAVRRPVPVRRS